MNNTLLQQYFQGYTWDMTEIATQVEYRIKTNGINNVPFGDVYVLFVHYTTKLACKGFCQSYYQSVMFQLGADAIEAKLDAKKGIGHRLAKRKLVSMYATQAEVWLLHALLHEVGSLARSACVPYDVMKLALQSPDLLYTDVCDVVARHQKLVY
jgi:hypothetical protein